MGQLDQLRGRRIYLDANLFIYAVEGHPEHAEVLEVLFGLLDQGDIQAVTSELTLAEVLVKPFEEGRLDISAVYEEMITPSIWLSVVPVERSTLIAAASLRGALDIKLPDAIHVASAMATGCEVFLSNDRRCGCRLHSFSSTCSFVSWAQRESEGRKTSHEHDNLCLASHEEVTRRALAAFEGQAQPDRIPLALADPLGSTSTRKRWELLQP